MSSRTIQQAPSPLSPFRDDNVLTEDQWNTLASIVDTIVPSDTQTIGAIHADANYGTHFRAAVDTIKHNTGVEDEALLSEYLAESATSCPEFRDAIHRFVAVQIDDTARTGLLGVLNALT